MLPNKQLSSPSVFIMHTTQPFLHAFLCSLFLFVPYRKPYTEIHMQFLYPAYPDSSMTEHHFNHRFGRYSMIKNITDIKLNVKPLFSMFSHKYYFEGPCRMAGGEALQPGFDSMVNGAIFNGTMEGMKFAMPDCVNLMEPVYLETSCDWDIKDAYFEKLLQDNHKVDVYLATGQFGADQIFNEFAQRAGKPIIIQPDLWGPARAGALYTLGVDVICELTWEDVARQLIVLRAQKCLREANLLLAPRFNNATPVAGATDSFADLGEVTKKLGVHFRTINVHELMDELHPLPAEGNYTTPGRVTPNITEEEIAELESMADTMLAGAEEADLQKEMLVKSLIAWKVVRKNMDLYDCSGAVLPCPDICSTRRINKEQITFCMCHSLNLEEGLAGGCEYDVASAVTQLAEIAVSGHAPYMGNPLPIASTDGRGLNFQILKMVSEEEAQDILNMDNLYVVYHSTPHRKFNGIKEPDNSYALRHFAYDQKFGAVFRHNFDENKGQVITFAKFSGDLKRLLIGKGTIVKSIGYGLDNCNGGFIFQVEDQRRVYKEQCRAGLHMPLVFGDYTQELKMLAERLGMDAVMV